MDTTERVLNPASRNQQGGVLIQVAVAIVGLIAFSVLVIDYGVMWASRRQAQNSADAAALAAALSMSFSAVGDEDAARDAAVATSAENDVWGADPVMNRDRDVIIGPCPADSPGLPDTCVRVNAFRDRANANPLPTFFGPLLGLTEQDARATATAQLVSSTSTTCARPWFIPDKWIDHVDNTAPVDVDTWTFDDEFDKYDKKGNRIPGPVDEVDPIGFDPRTDTGLRVRLKVGSPAQTLTAGWFFPVDLPWCDGSGPVVGGECYRTNIYSCTHAGTVQAGTELWVENGDMKGPTRQGVEGGGALGDQLGLIEQDPDAVWDESLKCVTHDDGNCVSSPRVVPIPVFDLESYYAADKTSGKFPLTVKKLVCFFVEGMQGDDVMGVLTTCPPMEGPSGTTNDPSSFLRSIVLIR